MISKFCLQACCVSICLIHIALLHGHKVLYGSLAEGLFYLVDEVHEAHWLRASYVVDAVRHIVVAFRSVRSVVYHAYCTLNNIVYKGEVAYHVAIVEHLYWLVVGYCTCEQCR